MREEAVKSKNIRIHFDFSNGFKDFFEGLGASKYPAESFLDADAFFVGEARALETDRVDADDLIDPGAHEVRGDIQRKAREALGYDKVPDPNELVDRTAAAEETAVAELDVAAEHRTVGESGIVANLAVMSHVGSRHEEIPVSEPGFATFAETAMDGDVLPEGIVGPDHDAGRDPGVESADLGISADHGTGTDEAAGAEGAAAPNLRPGLDPASFAEDDPGLYYRKGTDGHIAAEFGFGGNEREGVDEHWGRGQRKPASRKLK